LDGHFTNNRTSAHVSSSLRCTLDRQGQLQVKPQTSNVDEATAALVAASWRALLLRLLTAQRDDEPSVVGHGRARLDQRFLLPGTSIAVDAHVSSLLLAEDGLTLRYAIPLSNARSMRRSPERIPQVRLTQKQLEPVQVSEGQPVSAQMRAEVRAISPTIHDHFLTQGVTWDALVATCAGDSYPPYDYAWSTDLRPDPTRHQRYSQLALTVRPTRGGTPGTRSLLTRAYVTVIDMFGQAARTDAPVWYFPAQRARSRWWFGPASFSRRIFTKWRRQAPARERLSGE
jgi:hypothetical protein